MNSIIRVRNISISYTQCLVRHISTDLVSRFKCVWMRHYITVGVRSYTCCVIRFFNFTTAKAACSGLRICIISRNQKISGLTVAVLSCYSGLIGLYNLCIGSGNTGSRTESNSFHLTVCNSHAVSAQIHMFT